MKVIFLFLCVLVAVLADPAFRLPESEINSLKQIHNACQADKKTFCDEKILKKLAENQGDKQAGIHMLCMAEKAGLMVGGKLSMENIKKKIALGTNQRTAVDSLATKCAVTKPTPEVTAVQLWVCFVQNDIHYYHRL